MSKYTFINLVDDVFKENHQPLTPEEIWEYARSRGWDERIKTSGKTPWRSIGAQLYVRIRDGKGDYAQFSKSPVRFGLKDFMKSNESINENVLIDSSLINKQKEFKERDLHKLLVSYVNSDSHFKCRAKTILHEKSHKKTKGANEWLHPDIVGVYFPYDDFSENVLDLFEVVKDNPFKIFSFEVKKELNYSNLRECYFQAVSNSSWAHEGYLVSLDITDSDDFVEELSRLNNAFGIGVIKLNPENFSQSEIIFSAQKKNELDWNTIERMSCENPDFLDFIRDVTDDYKTTKASSKKKALNGNYDDYFTTEDDASEYAKKLGII